jgi:hypothetical protein
MTRAPIPGAPIPIGGIMDRMKDAIAWFKATFRDEIAEVPGSERLGIDFFAAIAVQESYEVWSGLWRKPDLDRAAILALCVGDTIGAPTRKAFPRTRADLVAIPDGPELFRVARQALVDVGAVNTAYHHVAVVNPDAFCHAFGIFQYDLQFAKGDAGFFLNRQWTDFAASLDRFMIEMKRALRVAGVADGAPLDHDDRVYVAIAYNAGRVDRAKGYAQGFREKDSGLCYGQLIDQYLRIAESVP